MDPDKAKKVSDSFKSAQGFGDWKNLFESNDKEKTSDQQKMDAMNRRVDMLKMKTGGK